MLAELISPKIKKNVRSNIRHGHAVQGNFYKGKKINNNVCAFKA